MNSGFGLCHYKKIVETISTFCQQFWLFHKSEKSKGNLNLEDVFLFFFTLAALILYIFYFIKCDIKKEKIKSLQNQIKKMQENQIKNNNKIIRQNESGIRMKKHSKQGIQIRIKKVLKIRILMPKIKNNTQKNKE